MPDRAAMTEYLPIAAHGLIGDGATAALVGTTGAIDWMCVPRFDSEPLFAGILDRHRGGHFTVTVDDLRTSDQWYVEDTGVLVTRMTGPDGVIEVTDALTLQRGADLEENRSVARRELVRRARVVDGDVTLLVSLHPFGGCDLVRSGGGWDVAWPRAEGQALHLWSNLELSGQNSAFALHAGEVADFVLDWSGGGARHRLDAGDTIDATCASWRRWCQRLAYDGPRTTAVRRSAITLNVLDHAANGAIVAAPTSSLPERIGGRRNWDYRYSWIRDAAFSVYAMGRIGMGTEADGFLGWVLDAIEDEAMVAPLYDLDGQRAPAERIDERLEGYCGSSPVRWGNDAAAQRQLDVYGEIIDCAFQWARRGGNIDPHLWETLTGLVDQAVRSWDARGRGIWEVRTADRPFTYSAALCQVAVDRGGRVAEMLGDARADDWIAQGRKLADAVVDAAWNPDLEIIAAELGASDRVDASILALPLRRLLPAEDARMRSTTRHIIERLSATDDLLYRYDPVNHPDGLDEPEGAFVLPSFWLVDNLALQGRLDEAGERFDALCDRTNHLGLLPEQIDPSTGAFLGNFPQAISHVGLVSSAVVLQRAVAA